MEPRWHALYVSSRNEKKVGELLNTKAINSYVPLVKTMRQWSDRKKMVELPLLNGYVFVNIMPSQYDAVLQTKGVVNFVKTEGRVAIIRDVEINRLKQLVELGYHLEANGISKKYKDGDKVRVSSGVLKGIEGYVVDANGCKEIEVLLESIGQCIRVKLPETLLVSV